MSSRLPVVPLWGHLRREDLKIALCCRGDKWPGKADLFIVRTDGMSCARETVEGVLIMPWLTLALSLLLRSASARSMLAAHTLAWNAASGCLSFGHPSSQQLLLVWNDKPRRCVLTGLWPVAVVIYRWQGYL